MLSSYISFLKWREGRIKIIEGGRREGLYVYLIRVLQQKLTQPSKALILQFKKVGG